MSDTSDTELIQEANDELHKMTQETSLLRLGGALRSALVQFAPPHEGIDWVKIGPTLKRIEHWRVLVDLRTNPYLTYSQGWNDDVRILIENIHLGHANFLDYFELRPEGALFKRFHSNYRALQKVWARIWGIPRLIEWRLGTAGLQSPLVVLVPENLVDGQKKKIPLPDSAKPALTLCGVEMPPDTQYVRRSIVERVKTKNGLKEQEIASWHEFVQVRDLDVEIAAMHAKAFTETTREALQAPLWRLCGNIPRWALGRDWDSGSAIERKLLNWYKPAGPVDTPLPFGSSSKNGENERAFDPADDRGNENRLQLFELLGELEEIERRIMLLRYENPSAPLAFPRIAEQICVDSPPPGNRTPYLSLVVARSDGTAITNRPNHQKRDWLDPGVVSAGAFVNRWHDYIVAYLENRRQEWEAADERRVI